MRFTRLSPRAIAAIVAVTAVLAVACSGSSSPTATPSPTARPSGDELTEFLELVDQRVIQIRGIAEPPDVPYRFVNDEELAEFIREDFDDPETREEIRATESIYRALGLISTDTNLYEEYLSLLNSQVLGAYDSESEEFVVLQPGEEFGPLEEFTYAHEYVHRLQDAQFDLEAVSDLANDNDDRSLAITALVEGDATSAQSIYGLRHMDLAALAQLAAESEGALEQANEVPYILRRSLEFPYVEGMQFVDSIKVNGGYEAVDAMFTDPPGSTEQILHPAKYVNREIPDTVTLPDGLFGEEWNVFDENVAGEFFLKSWLVGLGATRDNATAAAAGWGGDTYMLKENEAGEMAFALSIAWDDPARDPSEFFTVLSAALDSSLDFTPVEVNAAAGILVFDGPAGTLVLGNLSDGSDGARTLITIAPDLDTAMTALLSSLA